MEVDEGYYPMDVDDDVQQMLAREIAHMRQAPSIHTAPNNLREPTAVPDDSNQMIPEPCLPPPFAWEVQRTSPDWSTPNGSANPNSLPPVMTSPQVVPFTLSETPFGLHHLALVVDTNYLISYLSFLKDLMKWIPTPKMLVVIPWVVVKELDSLKEPYKRKVAPLAQAVKDRIINPLNTIDEGANARPNARDRLQDSARQATNFIQELQVARHPGLKGQTSYDYLADVNLSELNNDDRILECARFVRSRIAPNVLMMTNDKNLGVKSRIHGIDVAAHYRKSAQDFLNDIRISLGEQPVPIVACAGTTPIRKANGVKQTISTPDSEPRWGPAGNLTKTTARLIPDPPPQNRGQTRSATLQAALAPNSARTKRRDSLPSVNPSKEAPSAASVVPKRKRTADDDCGATVDSPSAMNVDGMDIDEDAPAAPKSKKKRKGSASTAIQPPPTSPAPISTMAQCTATTKSQQQQYEGVQEAKKAAIKSGTSSDALDVVSNELCRTLPALLTIGFRHVFDVYDLARPGKPLKLTSPPWSLEELFRMLYEHWRTCFSALLGNSFDASARKFCLDKSTSIVRGLKYGRTGATLGELRELVDHLIKFASLLRKSGCFASMLDTQSVERLLQMLKEKLQQA
ncbi:PIN domain-containing protein [Geranomyces variabilis]|nr:PIN domain-containing protein [Geranomyces variabilis]KAJ3137507.1 hypothetical protein HDU90_001910 [Geranomyces variabilis]